MLLYNFYLKLNSEVHETDFYEELNLFRKTILWTTHSDDKKSFIFQNDLSEVYPSVVTIYKIFFMAPVTFASAGRCSSKLKMIKNQLWYIRQEWLIPHPLILIEDKMFLKEKSFIQKKKKKKQCPSWLKPTKQSPGCPLLHIESSASCRGRAGHLALQL